MLFVCLFICLFVFLFVCLFVCLFEIDFKIVKYNLTNFSLSRLSQENLRMTSSLSWLASSPAASSSLEGLPRSHHGGDHHSHRKDSCGALQETWGEGGEETVRRGGLWRESKNTGGNRSRVKYSDKRWGGGVSGNMDRDKMSLSADAPRNPVMAQLYDVWRGGVLPSLIRLHKIKQPSLSWIPLDRWRGGCCCQVNYSKINCWVFKA